MNPTVRIVVDVLMIIGLLFTAIGALGVLRMPDAFGRMQASTCIASLGNICAGLAGAVYLVASGAEPSACAKVLIIMLMVLLTNPISNHALCKAAYLLGVQPAKKLVVDDYKEDDPE